MSHIPEFHDLSFYEKPEKHRERYDDLVKYFEETYGQRPEFLSRSPGRVNIMGDHIDYNLFSCLPIAIDVDVVAAVSGTNNNVIKIANIDASFSSEEIRLPEGGKFIEIDKDHHTWGNYFKCSLIVAQKFLIDKYPEIVQSGSKRLKGMNIAFSGTVPTGAGLSSSAAFCVASALAVLRINGVTNISKDDLCKITVVSEHYIGVNTGGMDQCASIYGEKNKALLVQFKPKLIGLPFAMPVIKPNDMVFLISNSLLKANKKETASTNYNLRVVETAIAAELLAHKFKLSLTKDSNLKTGTLRGFMDAYFDRYLKQEKWDGSDTEIGISRLEILLSSIEEWFTQEQKSGFSVSQIAKELDLSKEQFEQIYLTLIPVSFEKLKIYQRTKNVFSDALRVLQTIEQFQKYHPDNLERFLLQFGNYMNASHACSAIYNDSSTRTLNRICQISLANGSYGARVTGAAFGGSVVHLTTADKVKGLIQALKLEYYRYEFPHITEEEMRSAIVVSYPASGSCLIEI